MYYEDIFLKRMSNYLFSPETATIILYTDKGLEDLLKYYHVSSVEELESSLFINYGIILIDKRNG